MPTGQSAQSPVMVDMDSDELRIQKDKVAFMKNMTTSINRNGSSPVLQGQNKNILTPYQGNSTYSANGIILPSGKNYVCGFYESEQTNEGYVFVWNSNNNHFIYRLNADGTEQIVYKGSYLNFGLQGKYFIGRGRCVLLLSTIFDKVTGKYNNRKYLVFTDWLNDQRFIEVEDSIATNSFDYATFPIFEPKGIPTGQYAEQISRYINLGVATPNECIGVTPIARDPADASLQNNLLFKGWQWRIKCTDVYERESEHGIISERWFAIIGGSCLANSSGFPRCLELSIPAGNAFVDKIQIEFRNCSGNTKNLSNDSDWFEYDTIDKYNSCGTEPWYQRTIRNPYQDALDALPGGATDEQKAAATKGKMRYIPETNRFLYTFCGDKLCNPVDKAETDRIQPLLPQRSSSVFTLNNGIALANNERDFEPLSCDQLDKISFSVVDPEPDACAYNLRKVVIYAAIYNSMVNEVGRTIKIASSDNACFGVHDTADTTIRGQYFPDGQRGFIGYFAGTQYSCVSRQVVFDPTTGFECNAGLWDQTGFGNGCTAASGDYMQKFEFFVPPGRYVFRIASSRAELSSDYQRTSTLTSGQIQLSDLQNRVSAVKEIVVDCCTGDFISNGLGDIALQIEDFSRKPGFDEDIETKEGYFYESEISRIPIELNPLIVYHHPSSFDLGATDHNGFWYFRSLSGSPISPITTSGHLAGTDCTNNFSIEATPGNNVRNIMDTGVLHVFEVFVKVGNDVYPASGRRLITGDIRFCADHNIGIAGVPIVMQQTAPAITAFAGSYQLIAHNRYDLARVITISNWTDPFNDLSTYTDHVIYSQGGCQLTSCEDPCVYCIPVKDLAYKPCGTSNRNTAYAVLYRDIRGVNIAGPQHGGRYGLGVIMEDWMGRKTFVQASEDFFVDIPSIFKTRTFAYSTIHFLMDGSIVFPPGIVRITFCITDNLNWEDFLTWSVDKVQKVDAGGNLNNVTPTKVRIFYESLTEYGVQNTSVNATWQFITTNNTVEKAVTGDLVQFIKNGDNTFFNNDAQYQVSYDKAGKYFEIDYDPSLGEILPGAIYKLIRPKTCLTNNLYYELCPSIKVVDGVPEVLSGQFKYMDSYMLLRVVPVPVYVDNPDDPANPTKTVDVVQIPFYMEHPSPSDYWGDHCGTRGRVNIKNPYEKKKFNKMEVALSKALLNKGSYNGLSYYDLADIVTFEEHEWGGITVGLPENNTILFLCERDNFVVGFNDTGIRIAEGRIVAPSAPSEFGTPQHKIGANYGCQADDIATIVKSKGIVRFVDSLNAAMIYHNYGTAQDMSEENQDAGVIGGYKSWLKAKIAMRNSAALNGDVYVFVGGVDPKTNEYLLTLIHNPSMDTANINPSEVPVYINNELDVVLAANETIVLDAMFGFSKGFVSFTPEFYGSLSGHSQGPNMIAFKQGRAWLQHPAFSANPNYNNFFGVQCKKVIVPVWNDIINKVKRYLWSEVYCKEHKFIIDKVVTEAGQESRVLGSNWDKADKFYTADFKCAINTPADPNIPLATGANAILDGDLLYGRWIKPRYISQNADDNKYCELSSIVVYMIASNPSANS